MPLTRGSFSVENVPCREATLKATRTKTWRMMTSGRHRHAGRSSTATKVALPNWTDLQGCDHQIYESVIDLRDKRPALAFLFGVEQQGSVPRAP